LSDDALDALVNQARELAELIVDAYETSPQRSTTDSCVSTQSKPSTTIADAIDAAADALVQAGVKRHTALRLAIENYTGAIHDDIESAA